IEFERFCRANGIGNARTVRYLHDLSKLAVSLRKSLEKATKKDIEDVVGKMESSDYSPRTKLDFKASVKRFYKWLDGGEEYPISVRWIRTGARKNNDTLPEDLLTEDEVKKIIEACQNSRDRAIVAVLWESGCRIGELLNLRIRHVSFEENLTRIAVHGKTGARRMPLIDSTPYLAEWLENHPMRDKRGSPLWVGIGTVGRDRRLEYAALRKMLQNVARKAKIGKKVNPHNFRHSRATMLANHLTEAQMNQYFGWVTGSDMPSTYVHLSDRDVDDAILKMRGLSKPNEEEMQSSLAPKKCPRCNLTNKGTGRFCIRCGAVLDIRTAVALQDEMRTLDEKFSTLLQDEDVQKLLLRKMTELEIR
ncbi:MAG: tyrosine-type recombinase/integrase, partial [Thermoplasmata archaeon]|nr:tyrosine-type recombinase/integrase [Thermoplasmata archaeon]